MSESTSFTRMSEQLDHRKLIRKLDDISDQCYKLLQLCQDLEQSIQDHANDDTAHSDIRQEISIIDGKLISLNSSFAQQISDLTGTYNTKIDELTTKDIELEQSISDLHTDIDKITSGDITFDTSITSSVTADNIKDANAGTAIINSTAIGGTTAIANLKSPNGRFIIGTNDKGFDIDYTSNIHINNTNPDKQLVLLNEQGNSTFPGTITATEFIGTFNGDITGNAGTADNAKALNGLGSNAFVRKTGNITETITGSKTFSSTIIASAGITGTIDNADKLDNLDSTDFIRKTGSINENITGVKTFNNDIKSDTITAKSGDLTGSIGSVSIRYKSGYIDNIEASTLSGKLTGSLIGNASTATKLAFARKINGTDFNGTSAITTSIWGTARNMSISDNSGLHTGASTGVNGSEDYVIKLPYTITGSFEGNATTATSLAVKRRINGTEFNGSADITTANWGTARSISIADATSAHVGSAVSVNGSSNITLKLPSTIKGTLTGNADTATKLAVSKKINNTSFDGSVDITTAMWGTARDVAITDNTGEHVSTKVSVNGSANITLKLPSNITATNFYGVASSATKLNSAVTINGTAFDGTANITTAAWGYSRNMQITDSDSSNSGAITAVNGTNNVTLKLPSTIKGTLTGNASTATKLAVARKINGTNFDGTHDITTAYWGTGRNVYISDSDGTHVGSAVTMDGSGNVTLRLPGVIKADLIGNAASADKTTGGTVSITGYVAGSGSFDRNGNVTVNVVADIRDTPYTYYVGKTNARDYWGKDENGNQWGSTKKHPFASLTYAINQSNSHIFPGNTINIIVLDAGEYVEGDFRFWHVTCNTIVREVPAEHPRFRGSYDITLSNSAELKFISCDFYQWNITSEDQDINGVTFIRVYGDGTLAFSRSCHMIMDSSNFGKNWHYMLQLNGNTTARFDIDNAEPALYMELRNGAACPSGIFRFGSIANLNAYIADSVDPANIVINAPAGTKFNGSSVYVERAGYVNLRHSSNYVTGTKRHTFRIDWNIADDSALTQVYLDKYAYLSLPTNSIKGQKLPGHEVGTIRDGADYETLYQPTYELY